MILNFVGAFLIQLAAWATFCHVTYLIQLTLPPPHPSPYSATYDSILGQLTYWHVRLKQ